MIYPFRDGIIGELFLFPLFFVKTARRRKEREEVFPLVPDDDFATVHLTKTSILSENSFPTILPTIYHNPMSIYRQRLKSRQKRLKMQLKGIWESGVRG